MTPLEPLDAVNFPDLAVFSYWNYVPGIGIFTERSRITKVSNQMISEIVAIANDNQTKEVGQKRLIQLLAIRMDYRDAPKIRAIFTVVLCIMFVIAWTLPFLAIFFTLVSLGGIATAKGDIERDLKFKGELERKRIPPVIYSQDYRVPDLR